MTRKFGPERTLSDPRERLLHKLSSTRKAGHHHHHHHLLLQLLLKVFVVARAIFKRRNPGAAENGAEDVLGFLNIAMKDMATHARPHAFP